MVDDEDFEFLNKWKWHISTNGYAVSKRKGYMHRIINKTPIGLETDHIDLNKLNNQKKNLRSVTSSINKHNIYVQKNNVLGIKGVRWVANRKHYRVSIKKGSVYHLGVFKNKREAILAYKKAAIKLYGQI